MERVCGRGGIRKSCGKVFYGGEGLAMKSQRKAANQVQKPHTQNEAVKKPGAFLIEGVGAWFWDRCG
jgi:hypothetical protein